MDICYGVQHMHNIGDDVIITNDKSKFNGMAGRVTGFHRNNAGIVLTYIVNINRTEYAFFREEVAPVKAAS